MPGFACADVGNSRIKIMIGELSRAFRAEELYTVRDFFGESIDKIYYSSVNDAALQDLKKALNPSATLIDINKFSVGDTIADSSMISGMGSDRRLGLIGALTIVDAPLITVDFGTATTVNAIDKNRKIRGGVILPGIYTQLKSLRSEGSGLRNVTLVDFQSAAGKTTDEAVSSGIVTGTVGAVREIAQRIIAEEFGGAGCPIIATGGAFGIVESRIKKAIDGLIFDDRLVLKGIYSMAELVERV